MKNLTVYFAILFLLLMTFATGAIESNEFLIGALCAFLGCVSGILAIYFQENEKNKQSNYYYKE